MMNTYTNPNPSEWSRIATRPSMENQYLRSTIRNILDGVRKGGDPALREFSLRFDQVQLNELELIRENWDPLIDSLSPSLKGAIEKAAENIRKFHSVQLPAQQIVETTPGVTCWRKPVAIDSVGLYIPGGSAPLFSSVLMLAIPASLAGCREIIMCTPPQKDGGIDPAIIFAAKISGVQRIFKVGGAQAIGAMTYGTETIPKVDKVYGPGNQFVTAAKQLIHEDGVAIDMPAGPSELLVIADWSGNPEYIASDLLSQAEHGPDSQVILVSTSQQLITEVKEELDKQLETLPRKSIARDALSHSKFLFVDSLEVAFDFSNFYAPEHLIVQVEDIESAENLIRNAGSVFLGPYTPESAGDYASGTNHTLPTNGFAKSYSGLSVESFVKYITFQHITREGLDNLGDVIETMAENELLEAHKRAVSLRRK